MASRAVIPTSYANDDAFKAAWERMDPVLQSECERMADEIECGMAIYKDRMVGRPKRDERGFYGLAKAERQLFKSEWHDAPAAKLAADRKRVDELRHKLSDDAKNVADVMERNEGLEPFEEYAAAEGKTLPELLREFTAIEDALRRDPLEGMFMICDRYGADPLAVFEHVLRQPA